MKAMYTRLLNDILSILTTFLLILAPVAAIVYAAEPAAENDRYVEEQFAIDQGTDSSLKSDWFTNKLSKWKPDILDDTLSSYLTLLTSSVPGQEKKH